MNGQRKRINRKDSAPLSISRVQVHPSAAPLIHYRSISDMICSYSTSLLSEIHIKMLNVRCTMGYSMDGTLIL